MARNEQWVQSHKHFEELVAQDALGGYLLKMILPVFISQMGAIFPLNIHLQIMHKGRIKIISSYKKFGVIKASML